MDKVHGSNTPGNYINHRLSRPGAINDPLEENRWQFSSITVSKTSHLVEFSPFFKWLRYFAQHCMYLVLVWLGTHAVRARRVLCCVNTHL